MLNDDEKKAIEVLRKEAGELMTEQYNTDFNLLRWLQGYGFNLSEAALELRRHLRFRRFYDLDNAHQIPQHDILHQYFPIGLVGEAGPNSKLLVIESAGRIDLMGILKAVQLSDFLIQRYRFQEKMLTAINSLERKTEKQASVIYILDLDGLKFDTALLNTVTGPYRILWASVYTNYPEWIDTLIIINAPMFMPIIWKAIGPLLPERTRNKVRICTANNDWKHVIQEYCAKECVPKYWGGTLVDANGDHMCRDRLVIPTDTIPEELYWTPCKESPAVEDITSTVIAARKSRIFTYIVPPHDGPVYIVINRFCDRTFRMGIWYSSDTAAVDDSLDAMDEWFPDFDYPGMPTVDYLRIPTPGPGVFKMKLGNEAAWVRSLTVSHRIRFQNEAKQNVDFVEKSSL